MTKKGHGEASRASVAPREESSPTRRRVGPRASEPTGNGQAFERRGRFADHVLFFDNPIEPLKLPFV